MEKANGTPNTDVNKGFSHRHRSCPWGACGQQAKGVQILQTGPPGLIHGSPPDCLGSSGCQGRQDTRSPLRCTGWASVPPLSPSWTRHCRTEMLKGTCLSPGFKNCHQDSAGAFKAASLPAKRHQWAFQLRPCCAPGRLGLQPEPGASTHTTGHGRDRQWDLLSGRHHGQASEAERRTAGQ